MNVALTTQTVELDALMAEIERYLDAVALFRSLGHEPIWEDNGFQGHGLSAPER